MARYGLAPKVKVCCIASVEEARVAIAATVPPPITSFLLTSRQDADAIIEQHRRCRTNTLQLVDSVAHGELRKLRSRLPGIALVQVIHVTGPESVEEAQAVAPLVDAVLLDYEDDGALTISLCTDGWSSMHNTPGGGRPHL